MKKKVPFFSLILFILCSVSAFTIERGKESEVKIAIEDYTDILILTKMRIDLDFRGPDFVTAIVNEQQLTQLRAAEFKVEILIDDLKAHARELIESGELAAYHDPVALGAFLDSMVTFYPDITQLDTLGYSIQNRPLFGFKISDNADLDENEPEVHFDGLHHGDEKICVEVCVFMIRYLCENYGSNPQVTNIVNNREVLFFPMMNPDGHVLHQRYNAAGVDLNRDWGYMWDSWGGSPAPFSQPETRALREFVISNQSAIATTYHSGTEYISYPWSYQANPAPDKMPIDHLAAGYSSTTGYPYGQGCTGMYPIMGSAKDSYYGILGTAGWTVEISYQKTPPVSQIPYYCNLNKDAMLYLMEQAGEGLCGVVTDSLTGTPLSAIVEVEELWPIYTDPVIGDYHKFVLPGIYNLKVWANGYKTKTVQNVSVSSGGATQVNIELAPEDGTYTYRVVSCLVADPNSAYTNTSWTHYALGKQDGRPVSMGVNGWIVLDMGSGTPIIGRPGNDFTVYEGDASPEGYYVYISNNWAGPWQYIGNGIGTTGFDFATTGFSRVQYVKIVDDGDGNPNAVDAGFELDAIDGTMPSVVASITVTSPNGGELWPDGSNQFITWTSTGAIDSVKLEYSTTGGNNWITIVSSWLNNGSYQWTIPNTPSTNCLVRISDAADGAPWDLSDGAFTILEGEVTVTIPDTFGVPSQWITIPLNVSEITGLNILSVEIELTWNVSVLDYASASPGAIIPNGWLFDYNSLPGSGNMTIWMAGTEDMLPIEPLIGNGSLVWLTFNVVGQFWDSTYIHFEKMMFNEGTPVAITKDGLFQIPGLLDIVGNINYYSNDEPVNQAIVPTNFIYKDTTDAYGCYELIDLPSGDYVVRPEKEKDLSGALGAYDAAMILQYGVGGQRTLTPYQMIAADVSGNGTVSAYDAANILQYGVGIINKFPVMEDSTHFWRFVPEDFPISQTNWMIAPDSITYTPLTSDTTDNYVGIIYGDVSGNWHPSGTALASLDKSSAGTVNIILEDIYGEAGEKVILPVFLENGSDIVAMSFTLEYDAKVLKALIASATELTQSWQLAYNVKEGLIKLALAACRPIANSGAIVNLEFEVLKTELSDASSPLNILEITLNEGNISVNIQNAMFSMGISAPAEYDLSQNYPNPFNPETRIEFRLPEASDVTLEIYNVAGKLVRTLISGHRVAGEHHVRWDGRDERGRMLASGLYFYKLKANKFMSIKRMIIIK